MRKAKNMKKYFFFNFFDFSFQFAEKRPSAKAAFTGLYATALTVTTEIPT